MISLMFKKIYGRNKQKRKAKLQNRKYQLIIQIQCLVQSKVIIQQTKTILISFKKYKNNKQKQQIQNMKEFAKKDGKEKNKKLENKFIKTG